MKSLIIQNDLIHKKLKVLAAQLNKTIVQITEEAIEDIVEKYRVLTRSRDESSL